MDLKLTSDALLELEMANARGGNDWLTALQRHGNALLHDAAAAHREALEQQRESFQAEMLAANRRAQRYQKWQRGGDPRKFNDGYVFGE